MMFIYTIFVVHQFMVFSNFPIYNFFELDHLNILSQSPLLEVNNKIKKLLIENWDNSYQMLVSFQNKLYYTTGPDYFDDLSWDLETGLMAQHTKLLRDRVYHFAFTEINGKIWQTGGISKDEAIKETYFLLSNFTWVSGPELPEAKESHTMVTISETEVILFGGNLKGFAKMSANRVWIYNDKHKSFDKRKDFEIGYRPSAAMTYIESIDKEAILVLVKGRAFFYDISYDSWIKADNTWIHPMPKFELVKLFASSDNR